MKRVVDFDMANTEKYCHQLKVLHKLQQVRLPLMNRKCVCSYTIIQDHIWLKQSGDHTPNVASPSFQMIATFLEGKRFEVKINIEWTFVSKPKKFY